MTEPTTSCYHGGAGRTQNGRRSPLADFDEIIKDLKILEDNIQKPVPSNKIQKKAMTRIQKRHRRYVKSDGKSSLLANAYGFCAEMILNGKTYEAYYYCHRVIHFQLRVWNENNASDKALLLSEDKTMTERGLILHVAKRVPCRCLDSLRQEAKKEPRNAFCPGCKETKLFSEMSQCSACMVQLYCSEECNKKSWKEHKPACRARAKMDYMKKELARKEDGSAN